MALAIPSALKKLFGPAVNPADQAAAEATDPTDFSLALRRPYDPAEADADTADVRVPQSLKNAAVAPKSSVPEYAKPVSPKDVVPVPNVAAPSIVPSSNTDPTDVASATPTSEAPPSLKQPGPKSAVPQALLQLAGLTAPAPKPGELYAGPTTLADKIRAGIGFAAKVGNAGASAAGTPEQQKIAEQRAEFGPELKAKQDIAQAQIKSLGDYRRGELQNVAERNAINQQKTDQANQIAVGKMALKGQVPDEEHPGTFRFMTPDETLANPTLKNNLDLQAAALNFKNKSAELEQAKIDALNDPKSPTLQNKAKDLQIRWALAQQQFAQRQHALANQDASLAMRGREAMWQFGENPLTREQMTPENTPPAAMVEGEPTPMKSIYFPTTQMRNVGGQAHMAAQGIPGVIDEVKGLSDKLGPVAGRWSEFTQGKVGMNDPDFSGLRADLLMVSSAVALAHARGRLPENLREEFDNMMNSPQQTPENIVSILSHIKPWMENASHMHLPRSTSPAAGGAPTATPTAPAGKIPSFADWKKTQGGH